MRKQPDAKQVARLLEVQKARRQKSEATLAQARANEAGADTAMADATTGRMAAETAWLALTRSPVLVPEWLQSLGAELIAREGAVNDCETRLELARTETGQSMADWRLAEARVRVAETVHTKARRAAQRRRDEQQLADRAEIVTRIWSSR